jgi:lipid-A-disaccharide synthase
MDSRYLLIVAGEASGDLLGTILVAEAKKLGWCSKGSGGERMAGAGLQCIVPFSDLQVSGFLDVIPRLWRLRKYLETLRRALLHPNCMGLVCVDYPGFNLPLMQEAKRTDKPIYWVAPPQIWAWKPKRGRHFYGDEVAVFFSFEESSYQECGARPIRVQHPLANIQAQSSSSPKDIWALFPGSRMGQAKRNGRAYQRMGELLCRSQCGCSFVMVAPDAEVKLLFQRFLPEIEIRTTQEMEDLWPRVRGCVCPPGTASLELALRGVPTVVFTRVDWLTWVLGRIWLKPKFLALPNLLLQKAWIQEVVECALPWGTTEKRLQVLADHLHRLSPDESIAQAEVLRGMLTGTSLEANFIQFLRRLGG